MGRRHEINTMYHLLQLPSGSSKVQSAIQQTICDAYIAMTMVPEGDKSEGGQCNVMSWMKVSQISAKQHSRSHLHTVNQMVLTLIPPDP